MKGCANMIQSENSRKRDGAITITESWKEDKELNPMEQYAQLDTLGKLSEARAIVFDFISPEYGATLAELHTAKKLLDDVIIALIKKGVR